MKGTESLCAARSEAREWLEYFRESANPQTSAERWEYLDQAAVHIEALLAAMEVTLSGAELKLDDAARSRLKKFHDDGLVWLVNTAILHPRGLALAIHVDDETGARIGLSVVGEGDEPWVFGDDQVDDDGVPFGLVKRYMAAEAKREGEWSPKLRTQSDG